MLLLYAISIFLLLGAVLNESWQRIYLPITFIFLFVLSAFRDLTVGTDTISYEQIYLRLKSGSTTSQEIGWQFLNKLIIFFGGDFNLVLIITAFLVLAPIFYTVKKYSSNPMLAIFLFYTFYVYFESFNMMRQSIAMSFIFAALPELLINNRNRLYIGIVLLASTFHITALLALPLIFLNKIPDNKITYIVLTICSLLLGTFFVGPIIKKLADLLGYGHYLTGEEVQSNAGMFTILINLFFLFFLLTSTRRNVLFNLLFISIIVSNMISGIYLSYRIIIYFSFFQILYLPHYVNNSRLLKPIAFLIVVLLGYLYFWRTAGNAEVLPYSNTLINFI